MEGVWRKAKKALGAGLCVNLPAVASDREDGASEPRASDAVSLNSAAAAHASAPNTPAAMATEEAAALRRSKSGGKSSKVRPFLRLPSPSKSLSTFRVKICAWFAGNLARKGQGEPCRLRCGMSQSQRPACRPSAASSVGLGTDWSNVA
ncbi:unnamed protein product [Urochloa humidicola]